MNYSYVIVGAGLAGITMAERLAARHQKNILLIEKRNHWLPAFLYSLFHLPAEVICPATLA